MGKPKKKTNSNGEGYVVTLYNDDFNGFNDVWIALQSALKKTAEDTFDLVKMAESNGKWPIALTTKERAEDIEKKLSNAGLVVTVSQC